VRERVANFPGVRADGRFGAAVVEMNLTADDPVENRQRAGLVVGMLNTASSLAPIAPRPLGLRGRQKWFAQRWGELWGRNFVS
jgi:hypothetical protein